MNKSYAKVVGEKTYIGKPCPHGHSGERYVRNSDCVECRRVAKRRAERSKWHDLKSGKEKNAVLMAPPMYQKKTEVERRKVLSDDIEGWIDRSKKRPGRQHLTDDCYRKVIVKRCPLLGIELVYARYDGRRPDNYATLDRKDSSYGYESWNIQVISCKANTIKNNSTLEEMKMIVENWSKLVGGEFTDTPRSVSE